MTGLCGLFADSAVDLDEAIRIDVSRSDAALGFVYIVVYSPDDTATRRFFLARGRPFDPVSRQGPRSICICRVRILSRRFSKCKDAAPSVCPPERRDPCHRGECLCCQLRAALNRTSLSIHVPAVESNWPDAYTNRSPCSPRLDLGPRDRNPPQSFLPSRSVTRQQQQPPPQQQQQ